MVLNWKDKIDGVDYILAEDINAVVHFVKEIEENAEKTENKVSKIKKGYGEKNYPTVGAVADYVDNVQLGIEESISQINNYIGTLNDRASNIESNVSINSQRISFNSKRILNLEAGIPDDDFITDNSTSYVRDVPTNALPFAEVSEIGGMTYKEGNVLRSAPVTEVVSVGANIWNEQWEVGYINGNGIKVDGYTDRIRSVDFIPCLPNTAYFISGASLLLNFYDSNKTFISQMWMTNDYITTPNNCRFILFATNASYGSTYKNDIMINKGTTALPYRPYIKRTLTIPAEVRAKPWYGIGISKDVCNAIRYNEDGSRIGDVWCYGGVIDGSTGFMALDYQNTFAVTVSQLFAFPRALDAIADKYDKIDAGDIGVKDGVYVTNTEHIFISDSRFTDLATAKEILAANPINIVCAAMTNTTEDISDILPADNYIGVEGGGTITMQNENGYDVPATVTYQVEEASV